MKVAAFVVLGSSKFTDKGSIGPKHRTKEDAYHPIISIFDIAHLSHSNVHTIVLILQTFSPIPSRFLERLMQIFAQVLGSVFAFPPSQLPQRTPLPLALLLYCSVPFRRRVASATASLTVRGNAGRGLTGLHGPARPAPVSILPLVAMTIAFMPLSFCIVSALRVAFITAQ